MTPQQAAQQLPDLEQAARDGDVEAARLLARWFLVGNLVPRDVPKARSYYERAGELGSEPARMIAIGWLAAGTGGVADWQDAMRQLQEFGRTNQAASAEHAALMSMTLDPGGFPLSAAESRSISERPDVRMFDAFATPAECALMIESATPYLRPATVHHLAVQGQVHANVRTCHSMAFPLAGESPFVLAINRRIAAAVGVPTNHGEPVQVFRYEPGQEFKPHFDSGPVFDNPRAWTFLLYLNDDYEGGETRFTETGLTVKGKTGDAVLFRNVDAHGHSDPMTKHCGAPVTRGTKWLLSRWIRANPIDY